MRSFSKTAMADLIDNLPIGTVARLCGSSDLEDVAAYQDGWAEWVRSVPNGARWSSWEQCHEGYECHMAGVVVAAGFRLT